MLRLCCQHPFKGIWDHGVLLGLVLLFIWPMLVMCTLVEGVSKYVWTFWLQFINRNN
jgi:hypothetical protein